MSNSNDNDNIDWDDVIKKEARGSEDEDLGEVKETGQDYVLVQKGMINKEKFYIPKNMVESYDGSVLRFNLSKEEVKNRYMRDSPPLVDEYRSSAAEESKANVSETDTESRIPLIEERLNVDKRASTEEATITKEPITETKTVEVPVTHEEITIEKRPPKDRKYTSISSENPVESKTEIKVPLKKEDVEVTKQPYVKEEVVVKKKPVTETRQVNEQVRSEKISNNSNSSNNINDGREEETKEEQEG
jgi:uncharacterized protein (TIGR02271 family)